MSVTDSIPHGVHMLNVLNLGAGVQSTTVLLMSLEGELPPLDHVVFADTGWEPQVVYRHLDWLKTKTTIHVVSQGNIKQDALNSQIRGVKSEGKRWASMPYFIKGETNGMIRRPCTYEYKIRAIEKFLRCTVLSLKPRQRAPQEPTIEQWYGISLDELQRVRTSQHKWAVNRYPLIEKRMTRTACIGWLEDRGIAAPRSACIGCPFRHNSEWRHLRDNSPDEWQDAVEFDRAIRNCGGMRGEVFLHSQRVPLDEAHIDRIHQANCYCGRMSALACVGCDMEHYRPGVSVTDSIPMEMMEHCYGRRLDCNAA